MKNTWTEEEVALLSSGLSDKEIAEKIGKSAKAVYMKRRRVDGEVKSMEDYAKIEKKTKINSLKKMAKRLGVKLFGK